MKNDMIHATLSFPGSIPDIIPDTLPDARPDSSQRTGFRQKGIRTGLFLCLFPLLWQTPSLEARSRIDRTGGSPTELFRDSTLARQQMVLIVTPDSAFPNEYEAGGLTRDTDGNWTWKTDTRWVRRLGSLYLERDRENSTEPFSGTLCYTDGRSARFRTVSLNGSGPAGLNGPFPPDSTDPANPANPANSTENLAAPAPGPYSPRFSLSASLSSLLLTGTLQGDVAWSISRRWSIHGQAAYNPWLWHIGGKDISLRQLSFSARGRYWPWFVYSGWFFGGGPRFARYHFGGLRSPRTEAADAWGISAEIGFAWLLSPRWNLECSAGCWAGVRRYSLYAAPRCGRLLKSGTAWFLRPDSFSIALRCTF